MLNNKIGATEFFATGYYRVNYDNVTWFNIGRFLYHNDHRDIHVLNRAQIVDDAYHFLMEDKISLSSFVQLIAFLRKETDFIVWHSVMNVLQYMSPFFNFQESKYFKVRSNRKEIKSRCCDV